MCKLPPCTAQPKQHIHESSSHRNNRHRDLGRTSKFQFVSARTSNPPNPWQVVRATWLQSKSQSANRHAGKWKSSNHASWEYMKARITITHEPVWLPPRKGGKLIPPKLEQPKKKIPNYAEINRSFKKFCFDSGYIVQ